MLQSAHVFPSVSFGRLEVRGRISTATTMVRPPFAVFEPEPVRFSQRHSPSRVHLGARHVFHHARRLQGVANTGTLFAEDLQERQRPLPDEVITNDHTRPTTTTTTTTTQPVLFQRSDDIGGGVRQLSDRQSLAYSRTVGIRVYASYTII